LKNKKVVIETGYYMGQDWYSKFNKIN
jgi:hypothetical protein